MSEETNTKKNKIVKIVAVIAAFLLALVGGYFGSAKLMEKKAENNMAVENQISVVGSDNSVDQEESNTAETNTVANEIVDETDNKNNSATVGADDSVHPEKEAEEKAAKEKAEQERKEAEEKAAKEKAAKAAKEKAEKEKKAKEAAAKKEAESAKAKQTTTTSSTVATGKYKLAEKKREGALTIKSATANSVKFSINIVNLYGGYHMGELSGTATKISGNKYVYTNKEYGQTYKFYMQVNGNTIKVSTSKMINGDGFDPFCGANAVFDGTYKK